MYVAPCGRTLKNVHELISYIDQTKLAFCVTNFDFGSTIDPLRVFQLEPNVILAQVEYFQQFRLYYIYLGFWAPDVQIRKTLGEKVG